MRRAAKVDTNHGEIVATLRHIGAFVQSLAAVGKGCPDLLVGFQGRWFVLEIKDGARAPSAQKLSADEAEWHAKARLHAPVHIVKTVVEAIQIVMGRN